MAAHASPRDGDLVIARTTNSTALYGIRQVPTEVQLGASTRDEAVRMARSFAEATHVDIWLEENATLTLLARHRRAAQAG